MIEAITQENKPFRIICIKEPDYVMKIMASWMILDELEDAKTSRDFTESGSLKQKKLLIYRQTFGIHFKYRHQVDKKKNRYVHQFP